MNRGKIYLPFVVGGELEPAATNTWKVRLRPFIVFSPNGPFKYLNQSTIFDLSGYEVDMYNTVRWVSIYIDITKDILQGDDSFIAIVSNIQEYASHKNEPDDALEDFRLKHDNLALVADIKITKNDTYFHMDMVSYARRYINMPSASNIRTFLGSDNRFIGKTITERLNLALTEIEQRYSPKKNSDYINLKNNSAVYPKKAATIFRYDTGGTAYPMLHTGDEILQIQNTSGPCSAACEITCQSVCESSCQTCQAVCDNSCEDSSQTICYVCDTGQTGCLFCDSCEPAIECACESSEVSPSPCGYCETFSQTGPSPGGCNGDIEQSCKTETPVISIEENDNQRIAIITFTTDLHKMLHKCAAGGYKLNVKFKVTVPSFVNVTYRWDYNPSYTYINRSNGTLRLYGEYDEEALYGYSVRVAVTMTCSSGHRGQMFNITAITTDLLTNSTCQTSALATAVCPVEYVCQSADTCQGCESRETCQRSDTT